MPVLGRDVPWTQLYLGLSFTTLATLILELSLTRIFSVVFYYHFAFLAISIALFGLGAGGVFSYIVAARPGNLYAKLGALGSSASAAVMAALLIILFAPGELGYLRLAMVYLSARCRFSSPEPWFRSPSAKRWSVWTAPISWIWRAPPRDACC